jgi:hypothetical protein
LANVRRLLFEGGDAHLLNVSPFWLPPLLRVHDPGSDVPLFDGPESFVFKLYGKVTSLPVH